MASSKSSQRGFPNALLLFCLAILGASDAYRKISSENSVGAPNALQLPLACSNAWLGGYASELYTLPYTGCLVPSKPGGSCSEAPFKEQVQGVTPEECAEFVAASGQRIFSMQTTGRVGDSDLVSCQHTISAGSSSLPSALDAINRPFGEAWTYLAIEQDAPRSLDNYVCGFPIYSLSTSLSSGSTRADDGPSRGIGRSLLQDMPALGSVKSLHFELQFDGLALTGRTESFKGDYCAELAALTKAEGALCFVQELRTEGSSVFVKTGLYYPPDPIPDSAIGPDSIAAAILIGPANVFSPSFKDSYGPPSKSSLPVVTHVYAPPPPRSPPPPPRPTYPSPPARPPFPPPSPIFRPTPPGQPRPEPGPSPSPPTPEIPAMQPPSMSPPPPASRVGCEKMEEIETLMSSQVQELESSLPAAACSFECILDSVPTYFLSIKSLQCVFNSVKCLESRSIGQSVESEFLSTILDWQVCMLGGFAPEWKSGLFEPFFESVQAISSSTLFKPDMVCDVISGVRMASKLHLEDLSGSNIEDAATYIINFVAGALASTDEANEGGLSGYSDPVTGNSDVGTCSSLVTDFRELITEVAEAVLNKLSTGETVTVGSGQVQLILTKQDATEGSDMKFVFDLPGGGFTTGDGARRRLRHRALAAIGEEYEFTRDRKPEIDMPGSFSEACNTSPALCPQPVAISLSYTAESAYLMVGLGTAVFVSAAAEFANVSTSGLMVAPVSGTLGLRLPFASETVNNGLLGSWTSLHFPLDGQVAGATSPSGKLCVKIDYFLMRPVVIGAANITDGVASCMATSAGDYLIIQLAYGLADPSRASGIYTATRLGNLDPLLPGSVPEPSGWKITLAWGCGIMAVAALSIILVMWFKYKPPPDEDAWIYDDYYEEHSNREFLYLVSPARWRMMIGYQWAKVETRPITPPDGSWTNDKADIELAGKSRPATSDGATPGISTADAALSDVGRRGSPAWPGPVTAVSGMSFSRTVAAGKSSMSLGGNTQKLLLKDTADTAGARSARRIQKQTTKLLTMDAQGRRDRNGRTALHIAIVKKNFAALTALTHDFGKFHDKWYNPLLDPAMQDVRMRTPLHTAAEVGDVSMFNYLLKLAGDSVLAAVSMKDLGGNTVLHIAAAGGNAGVVMALQDLPNINLDIDLKNQKGWTALQLAVSNGELETVEQLLESSPDVDATSGPVQPEEDHDVISSRRTALHIATVMGRKDIARLLLDHLQDVQDDYLEDNFLSTGNQADDGGLLGTDFEYDDSTDDSDDEDGDDWDNSIASELVDVNDSKGSMHVSGRHAPRRSSPRGRTSEETPDPQAKRTLEPEEGMFVESVASLPANFLDQL